MKKVLHFLAKTLYINNRKLSVWLCSYPLGMAHKTGGFKRMLKSTLTGLMLPLLLLFGSSSDNSAAREKQKSTEIQTETVEKLIVASGSATMDVDLNRLNDAGSATEKSKLETLRFALAPDSFFTIVVTNNVLRAPLPGSMGLIPQNAANLPALLNASFHQLVLEKSNRAKPMTSWCAIAKAGSSFSISKDIITITMRASIRSASRWKAAPVSEEFASQLGRPSEAGLSQEKSLLPQPCVRSKSRRNR